MNDHLLFGLLLVGVVTLSVVLRTLTLSAALMSAVIALCVYAGFSWGGLALLGIFFVTGVLATRWKAADKKAMGFAESDQGRRGARQVFANGGVAALLGVVAYSVEDFQPLLSIMMAASFSAATADTLSSELGMVYGRKCYNIVTMRRDVCGENGVITMEGTLIGIAGSALIAAGYCWFTQWSLAVVLLIVLAGTIGNLGDSILGATMERRQLIGNNTVNLVNTLTAAAVAGVLGYLWFVM